eukprot:1937319-Pyramimonas_sp.AAC.1
MLPSSCFVGSLYAPMPQAYSRNTTLPDASTASCPTPLPSASSLYVPKTPVVQSGEDAEEGLGADYRPRGVGCAVRKGRVRQDLANNRRLPAAVISRNPRGSRGGLEGI